MFGNWVQIAGQKVPLADIREHPDRYVRLLATARQHRDAICLCRPTPLPLVTRMTRTGRLCLACWPHQGTWHHRRCAFHRLDPELSGRRGYSASAILETAAVTSIRYASPLTSAASGPDGAASASPVGGASPRRTVGPLGLLHYLWEAAELTAWPPESGHRRWPAHELADVLDSCLISGQPAAQLTYVMPVYTAESAQANLARYDRFIDGLQTNDPGLRRGFVLAEIKAIHTARHGVSYQLAHQNPRRQVFVSAKLDERLRSSYPAAFCDAAHAVPTRRVGLFYVERSRGGYTTAVDAAVMLTNREYIPADSSYEVQMADALAAAGRAFIKPLTFDAGHDVVLPDFVLTDQEPSGFVEVWGLPGRAEYEARKARKVAHYQRGAPDLIEWTVTDPLPAIPRTPQDSRKLAAE
ncbi:DUF1173 family protein [Mycolicibacterium sp. CBMA 226]|uniref:DUF1173 family protein n=1 Tax=Mycolicibacterium sp. CBMA 226 TaxID=2606611 RepID=UPI0012DCB681|nr:DUF1173 family protein [Mycolicibacterium sp. CBMA 226]MUL78834.1 DUF1173 domain-containing protein [Mycolicibacterium sp. CBMA 226]QGW61131.1 hypothetical protein ICEMyc226_00099 [Mycolicibacterium sp.]